MKTYPCKSQHVVGLDMKEASWKCMDQNKQEQQYGDVVMCFYWLSDPEKEVEEAFYKLLKWTSHSQSQWL